MFAILKPHEVNRNNPNQSIINPYIYKDEQEIRDFIKIAHKLDISDLFLLVEYVWILDELLDRGLIIETETDFKPHPYYEITERGPRCLELFGELDDDLRSSD